jgi:hypothetical protein
MPCGAFEANGVFFSLGVLAYNLYLGFRTKRKQSGMALVQTIETGHIPAGQPARSLNPC